jgi:hypothetical protein
VFRFLNARFYYGWVIVAVAGLINVASSPLNTAVFSFFVDPMSDDRLGWRRRGVVAPGATGGEDREG